MPQGKELSDTLANVEQTSKNRHGSAPGERRGGRAKGTKNKRTAAVEAAIAASGLTPLEYMLSVLNNAENSLAVRMDAAKGAAPYVHAKLSSIDVGGKEGKPIQVEIVDFASMLKE